jgi:hypothetical protein
VKYIVSEKLRTKLDNCKFIGSPKESVEIFYLPSCWAKGVYLKICYLSKEKICSKEE